MIVHAELHHLEAIGRIYNQAVADGLRTAHLEPLTNEERIKWFRNHNAEKYPVYVYLEDESVLGWVSVSAYRSGRGALGEVVEISYYVDYARHGEGIATGLLKQALDFCTDADFRIALAILIRGNEESIGLLEKFGFEEWGNIPDAIHYKGTFRDHVYMGLIL